MKSLDRYIFFILFFISLSIHAQNSSSNSFSIKGKTLGEAILIIEERYDVQFSYDADIVEKELVNLSFANLKLEKILLKLLRNAGLEYEFIRANHILISKQTPEYRRRNEQTLYIVVIDKEHEITLPDASVIVENSSIQSATDMNGKLSLRGLFTEDDTIKISYVGYETLQIPIAGKFNKPYSPVFMSMTDYQLQDVIVTDRKRSEDLFIEDITKVAKQYEMQKVKPIGGFVEKDVLQIVQLLPGVTGSDESASQFNIRGGATSQNMVLFDGIKMYHFGHYFGKISALNPHFINKVEVYKDCYPAQYSGRVAGVIDVKSSDVIPNRWQLSASTSLIAGSVSATLPLFKQKAALSIGYRRSLTDILKSAANNTMFEQFFQHSKIANDEDYLIANSLTDVVSLSNQHHFYDFNIKYLHRLSDKTIFKVSYINVEDELKYRFEIDNNKLGVSDNLRINNKGVSMYLKHHWNKDFSSVIISTYSHLNNRYINDNELANENLITFFHRDNTINDYSYKILNAYNMGKNKLTFGYEFTPIDQKIASELRWDVNGFEIFNDSTQAKSHAIFGDYSFEEKRVFGKISGRLNQYNLTNKYYPESGFMIGFRSKDKSMSFKFSGGEYYQSLNQIVENNNLNAEDYIWLLARDHHQDDSGLYSLVFNRQMSLRVDKKWKSLKIGASIYKKNMTNIPSRIFKNNEYNPFYEIDMDAYGLELDLTYQGKSSFTYASYTYGNSRYLYNRIEYPTAYDKPHVFSILQGLNYKKFALSLSYNLSSGKPYTPIISIEHNDENDYYYFKYADNNSARLPLYSRWDATLQYKLSLKRTELKFAIGVINLLNRDNIIQRNYMVQYPDMNAGLELKTIEINRLGLGRLFNFSIGVELK